MSIERVAVLGAGVMGSGIAAQVANAGFDVILLDIVPEGANDRNVIAAGAVEKMAKTQPAPLMAKLFSGPTCTGWRSHGHDRHTRLYVCDHP